MQEIVLKVHPAGDGWWIDCDLPLETTCFSSGERAEEAARSLALRLRGAGYDVRLLITDGSDQLVEVRRYAPM